MKNSPKSPLSRHLLILALAASLACQPLPALAGSVALATVPLTTATPSKVKPNVMFILDDSGSMGWDYLPDWANDSDPTSSAYPSSGLNYNSVPALFRNNSFNGVAYNPAITYTPPVLYNADGTLNTTTYPNIVAPWTSVKNDAFGIQSTSSTDLINNFPDKKYCVSSSSTDCLRNDNLLLPGTVGGKNYTSVVTTTSSGTGSVATGDPDAPTTAARSFGPFFYTTIPGEYCDAADLKNCQSAQTATFSHPAPLRWCSSAANATATTPAAGSCRAIQDGTYKYPRYPTLFYSAGSPGVPAQPAHGAIDAVVGVAASASFTFDYIGSLNPIGFSIKVNGTEMLTSTSPSALKTSAQLATWVQANSSLAGYSVLVSGSTVTITANTTGTAYNINSIVITETPAVVTATTNPSFAIGADGGGATVRPTGLITFGGTTTSSSNSAWIDDDISGKSIYVGDTDAEGSSISIGKSKTPAQAAAAVVAEMGTANSIKAYVGGNSVTPLCAAQSSNVVCLVDTTTYTNGRGINIGSTYNFGGLTMSTTATADGNNGTGVKAVGTITFDYVGSLNPTGFSIKVNGTEMLTSTTPGALTSASSMDGWVSSNSSLPNYVITSSGSTVTITAAAVGSAWTINSITISQDPPAAATSTAPTYVAGVDAVAAQPAGPATPEIPAVPAGYFGRFIRTDIVPSITSYPYPGSATKANTRTDCAGTTCTYAEEMTNFANWWTYYHTRMQAMKTSVSRAFKTLDNRFRVGFSTIGYTGASNSDARFLGNDVFELAHKNSWFTKMFATDVPGTTPLRGALSKAGRYYGKKISGQVDPVQYSCQQNFAILSTDGYWNTNAESGSYGALNLTGGSVGDLDGGTTPRPMKQGTTAVSNTLADIAKYYYDTDLRTSTLNNCTGGASTDHPSGTDVCENNVFTSSSDNNLQQHMTTFTMGLGIDGTLNYTTDYATATSGDFYNLKNGLGSPTVNWPDPISNSTGARIDDLWHAAINGRGTYFSAKDPDSIITGFNTALSSITAKLGAAASAATSTLNPVAGNNFAYLASYTTNIWKGNLESRSINTSTAEISSSATWCVENVSASTCSSPGTVVANNSGSSTVYNCVVANTTAANCTGSGVYDATTLTCSTQIQNACTGTMAGRVGASSDTRAIYTANTAGNALVAFDAAYATANPTYFAAAHINGLNQWGSLTVDQRLAAEGVNLINYLRGQNGHEDRAANLPAETRLYRTREGVLGDALESQPAFISKPVFNYPYPGYSDFKSAHASRAGSVYLGANDGMLHAFDASNGSERWAYVPSMVIPNMWQLASTSYSSNHVNFVNGSPVTTDVCTDGCSTSSAVWKTILVAGLNGGGRGYYALDITDPATPALMWEFSPADDPDLGYTYGIPVVTKKQDGTWVVLVTSGYDNGTLSGNPLVNNSPVGDGVGYLYVLDTKTGGILSKISTGVGSAASPSGLSKISAWNNDPNGNEASYVYGGDLLGNVWRFDINSNVAADIGTGEAMLFATLEGPTGEAQPVTTTPQLGQIAGKRYIFISTGKFLEASDRNTTAKQTLYSLQDDDITSTIVNPRNTLPHQTIVPNPDGTATRVSGSEVSVTPADKGCYVDFPDSGERANIDSKLIQGIIVAPTIVPIQSDCSPGGYSWLNYVDYETCSATSIKSDSSIVGINEIYTDGKAHLLTVNDAGEFENPTQPDFKAANSKFKKTRTIWRELIRQ